MNSRTILSNKLFLLLWLVTKRQSCVFFVYKTLGVCSKKTLNRIGLLAYQTDYWKEVKWKNSIYCSYRAIQIEIVSLFFPLMKKKSFMTYKKFFYWSGFSWNSWTLTKLRGFKKCLVEWPVRCDLTFMTYSRKDRRENNKNLACTKGKEWWRVMSIIREALYSSWNCAVETHRLDKLIYAKFYAL